MKYMVLCIGISFLNMVAAEHGTLILHNKTHQPITLSYFGPIDTKYGIGNGLQNWKNKLIACRKIASGQSISTNIRTPSSQQPQEITVTFDTIYGQARFFLKKKNSNITILEENPWIQILSTDSKKNNKRIALFKYTLAEIAEQKNDQSSDSD